MAGQLTIDTLKASSGVLATQNGMTGIAKAWVQFNGTAATITGSFNVSSITKNGTGDYTVTYTTAMPNANYSATGMAGQGTTGYSFINTQNSTYSTTTIQVYNCVHNGSLQDGTQISVQIISA